MKTRVMVTARDLKLIEVIDAHGMLSTSQIKRLIFPKIAGRTAQRRLSILEKEGLLKSHYGLPRGELVWTLLLKGAKRIGSDLSVKTINRNTLYHDYLANQVRLRMHEEKIGRLWRGGHRMKLEAAKKGSVRETIPDNLFGVTTQEGFGMVAMELEISAKSKKRYAEVLDLYSGKESINYVWYIVPTKGLGEKIVSQKKSSYYTAKDQKLMWSFLDEVLESPKKAMLYLEKESHRLGDFFKKSVMDRPKKPAQGAARAMSKLVETEDLW